MRMGEERSHMTERILNLTLEIIYLLTGESFPSVKPGDHVTIMVPQSSMPQKKSLVKIVEATKKMMELLTGEVPIRCQDVAVYLSMEEWEYLEGHKDLYKDVTMEDEPDGSRKRNPPQRCPRPREDLPIPRHHQVGEAEGHEDLFKDIMMEPPNDRNPPKRSPRPRNSTREDLSFPCLDASSSKVETKDKIGVIKEPKFPKRPKNVYKKNTEKTSSYRNPPDRSPRPVEDLPIPRHHGHNDLYKGIMMEPPNDRNPPQRGPRPRESTQKDLPIPPYDQCGDVADYNIVVKEEYKEEDEEYGVMEEITMEPPDDPPQRYHRPLYARDLPIPRHDQGEDLITMKVEGDEETYVREDQRSTEEAGMMRTSIEEAGMMRTFIGEDGRMRTFLEEDIPTVRRRDVGKISQDGLALSLDDEDVTQYSPGDDYNVFQIPYSLNGPSYSSYSEDPQSMGGGGTLSVIYGHDLSPRGQESYPCPDCGKCFTQKSYLSRHRRSHTGERPYSCSVCGKSFSHTSSLCKHQKIHTGVKPYSCNECGKCFAQRSELVIHQRSHTGEKPYPCPECGKCFSHQTNLSVHKKFHTGEKPHPCPECGKRFCTRSALAVHVRAHKGEKPYSCSECVKRFPDKSSLNRHQRLHTGEKPYACTECNKCFLHKYSLTIHQRSHTGVNSYCCPVCGKTFIYSSALARHKRCHTGEKPYCCPECGKGFSDKSNLSRHQRCHTGEKPHCCPQCGKRFLLKSALHIHLGSHERKALRMARMARR